MHDPQEVNLGESVQPTWKLVQHHRLHWNDTLHEATACQLSAMRQCVCRESDLATGQ